MHKVIKESRVLREHKEFRVHQVLQVIKEFRVKSPREGGRKRFLDGKAEMYKTACQQWNTLDKSKRPRLEV